ncbi:hypothetical protein [Cohnella sp. AR92]|uniref:hypothetical protein n=1 Tax=Cohnella sp. AR92 TaxID=648716 RepID=UPI000F8F0410|nr:hypothetical protein [Cohnella sp. AR92]RUS44992.1 hypothetical protein ELR57_22315 [Cohnella sp. AR92]
MKDQPMNKKLQKIIEKEAPLLLELERNLKEIGQSDYLIKQSIKGEMENRTSMLMNLYSADLNNAFVVLKSEETNWEKKILDCQRNNVEPDPLDLKQKELITMQIRIIENALNMKKQYHKKPSGEHPIEREMVKYPLISASSPKETKMKQMRNNKGVIVQERNGFRKLYYENERGTYLTMHDERVLIGLFRLWLTHGKQQTISFDFKELADEMFIVEPSGGEYNAILNSLKNLYSTSIVMEEYMDPSSNESISREYHRPIHTLKLIGKPNKERAATVTFHDYVQSSMAGGNFIMINMLLYNDLKNDTTKVLYPFILSELSKNQDLYMLDMNLMVEQFNISPDNESRSRSLIMNAMEELEGTAELILEPTSKKLAGRYYVSFKPHPEYRARGKLEAPELIDIKPEQLSLPMSE